MRQIHDQQYAQFTPKERINLTLAALSRGDESEANRLWQTCPKHKYRAHDFEYTLGFNALMILGSVFFEKCIYHYNHIKKVELFILHSENDLKWEKKFPEIAAQSRKNIDLAKKAQTVHTSKLKALFEGFRQFCAEVEVDSENILNTTTSIGECCHDLDWLLNSDDKLDIKYRDEIKAYFLELWDGTP